MVISMTKKNTSHYVRFTSWVVAAAAVVSAASYFVSRPAPVYEDGKLILTTRFAAHDNGFPLTFIHNTCYGNPLVCHQYFDSWGFISNTVFLAAAIALGWYAFKLVKHRRK